MFGAAPGAAALAPTPDSIRQRLDAVLRMLRVANEMPWSSTQAQTWRMIVPQMANWLPEDEAHAVRNEFSTLLDRLQNQAT